jgi:AcrR family transcriptional regulator
MATRKYKLRQRAEQQEQTRERIVDAAIALHEELGPAATTISALAERAGVQRLTVYRHFPDETAILQACSSKWFAQNAPPDPAAVGDAAGAAALGRTRALLLALYGYYEQTERMWRSLYHDLGTVAALDAPMARFAGYLEDMSREIVAAWSPRRSKRLRATAGHAVQFSSWQSLTDEGLGRQAMADLVSAWIERAASP